MKVLLINPPTSRAQDEVFFPMGLITVGSILKQRGFSAEIVDFDLALRHHPELRSSYPAFEAYTRQKIRESDAAIFGISSICNNFPYALEIAEWIRDEWPEAKIVLGGPQPSSVPVDAMEACAAIDAIVVGEGEDGFLELLRSDWNAASLRNILGICYREGGSIQLTSPRPLIEDLDTLPFPDFSLVSIADYQEYNGSLALIEAGRGCPFRCNFCSTAEMWVRKYRVKSPARIHREMQLLNAQIGMSYFSLTHDNFTTSPKYNRKFCQWFLENNPEGFTWNASARTDTVTIDDLDLMQRAGCRSLFFGVDSGSKRIQDVIDKHLDLEEFKTILNESVKRGISAITSFIVGFPEETEEDVNATIAMCLWSKYAGAQEVQIHRLSPLASTKVYSHHAKDLRFSEVVSDMSFIIFPTQEILRRIAGNPRLFSSFFEVPMPQLSDVDVFCFSNFYHAIVNDIGASLHWYLLKAKKTPLDFYREWYAINRETDYMDLLTKPYVLDTVAECF
ncbi:MAG TPA: radical SAM protein [bacterium]|nr:radical SAM protein [bacterium]